MVNVVLIILIAAAMFFAARRVIRNFASGGCGCGCSGCSEAKKCESAQVRGTK